MKSHLLTHSPDKAHWSAIFSLFIGVTSLIAAEFIPVSLLTVIAQELNITEGTAGQSVTVVGIFAVIASLALVPLIKKVDRRSVLLTFSSLLVISNVMVALAPNYTVLLIGRCLLGICVGGFWSMIPAVILKLAPTAALPRAFSIVYAGVSVAAVISLPLASYLGHLLGWRNVFFLAAFLGVIAFVWQFISLPSLPPQVGSSFKNMLVLVQQNWVFAGIMAIVFSYGGYHLFFTYLRPFLEFDLTLAPNSLATALFIFGIASCIGPLLAGWLLSRVFKTTMFATHLIFLVLAVLLFLSDRNVLWNTVLVMLWGFMFGFITVGWSTWIARTLADKAELVGGLSVAAIQFSIGLAAALGGLIFDNVDINGIFITAAISFLLAIILIKLSFYLFNQESGGVV